MTDSTAFLTALAERLAEVLPAGFAVHPGQGTLSLDAPDGFGVGVGLDYLDDPEAHADGRDLFVDAAWSVLSSIQDCVSHTLRTPWPHDGTRAATMAMPGAKRDGRVLHLWFGDESDPVLRLRPVELDDPGA